MAICLTGFPDFEDRNGSRWVWLALSDPPDDDWSAKFREAGERTLAVDRPVQWGVEGSLVFFVVDERDADTEAFFQHLRVVERWVEEANEVAPPDTI